MKRFFGALCLLTGVATFGATVWANDEPPQPMPGKILIIKAGKLAKFIAKPISPDVFTLPGPQNDPTVEGATLAFQELGGVDEISTTGSLSASLPASGWKALSSGFKYTGAGSLTDPCRVVLVKPKIVKGICKGAAVDMNQPITGPVAIVLEVGTSSKSYCTTFGGVEVKNDDTLLKRKDATTAAACSCGASAPSTLTFQNGAPTAANCGTVTTAAGASSNLACDGLYLGSGSGTLTLPEVVPDSAKALVMDVACCTGDTLLLSPTASTETGDIETCTSAGCLFGAPLPLPNTTTPATSTCIFNSYSQDVVGEATCGDGNVRLNAPLNSRTFLTGDLLPRRCSGGPNAGALCPAVSGSSAVCGGGPCVADPDIQPCPICNTTTGKCNGGFNGMDDANQASCVPDGGLNIALPQFPTSHTCTISTLVLVGDLPVPFLLSTGTQTDVAAPSGGQQRVFCGFCRDALTPGGTGGFGICNGGANNGMTCAVSGDCPAGLCTATPCESDADCAGDTASRESCQQRNEGAFGPGGGGNKTITETGTPAGDISDFAAHQGTLVSVFCIPPSFNAIIDGAADLGGPGAVSLPGTVQLQP
jgi:hypothetical protein